MALVVGMLPSLAYATPPNVSAYYMYGTSLSGLENSAYNDGCSFATNHPSGDRMLMLDFGAARKIGSDYGTVDFSNVLFTNPEILEALKSASNGAHNCYNGKGATIIAYGNSNYNMTGAGMSNSEAHVAGYSQAEKAGSLDSYEESNGRKNQSAAAGVDMEPSYDKPAISNELVKGANSANTVYIYDFGSADGCPSTGTGGSCSNGWNVKEVGFASFGGCCALPMPEIYYEVNAGQWTVVRKKWDEQNPTYYYFSGSTGETGGGITPGAGWDDLSKDNPELVAEAPGIICFGC